MTIEAWTRAPLALIQTTGPYAIPHPYAAAAIKVAVLRDDGTRVSLAPSDFSLSPEVSADTGTLTLTPAAFEVHEGGLLVIDRDTVLEQGWIGRLGQREKGLEAQLDLMTMAIQENRGGLSRAIRLDVDSPVLPSAPNMIVGLGDDGLPTLFPRYGDDGVVHNVFPSRAAAEAATVLAPVLTISVVNNGRLYRYVRDTTGPAGLAAITTNGGAALWRAADHGGYFDPAAWGTGWTALWRCWEWQKAVIGDQILIACAGQIFIQPETGDTASRRLTALGVHIDLRLGNSWLRRPETSTVPIFCLAGGYTAWQGITSLTYEPVTYTENDDEEGEGGSESVASYRTVIGLASMAGFEDSTGRVAMINNPAFTPMVVGPPSMPEVDGYGDPVSPGNPNHPVRAMGENVVIDRADVANSRLIVQGHLFGQYAADLTTRVWLYRQTRIRIEGGVFEDLGNRDVANRDTQPMIHIESALAPIITEFRVPFAESHVVQLLNCYAPEVSSFDVGYMANKNNSWHAAANVVAYVVRVVNTQASLVTNGFGRHLRHVVDHLCLPVTGFSFLKDDPLNHPVGTGATIAGRVSNCYSQGGSAAAFGTHDGTIGCIVDNCHVLNPKTTAFAFRGVNHQLRNCSDTGAVVSIRAFIGSSWQAGNMAETRGLVIKNHTSVNVRGHGMIINAGAENVAIEGWNCQFTEDANPENSPQRLVWIKAGAEIVLQDLRINLRRQITTTEVIWIDGANPSLVRIEGGGINDYTGLSNLGVLLRNTGAGALTYQIDGFRAARVDDQSAVVSGLWAGNAPAAGSYARRHGIVGVWSEDEVAPDRATVLAAYVSHDRRSVSYLSGGIAINLRREPSVVTNPALVMADGKYWLPSDKEWSPRAFGAIGAGDDTDAMRACCGASGTRRVPVTLAGIDRLWLQSDAQIFFWSSLHFHGCILSALNGMREGTSFSMSDARQMLICADPSTPLNIVNIPVTASNFNEFSRTPTIDAFAGPGFCYLQGADGSTDLITNRDNTGTLTYRQSFRVSDNGKVIHPLARALPGTTSARFEYRAMAESGTLEITGAVFDLSSCNNQIFILVRRNGVVLRDFSATGYGSIPPYHAHAMVRLEACCNIALENWTFEAVLPTGSGNASYVFSADQVAEVRVTAFHAYDGWGATASNHVNGFYISHSTLNRMDCHAGGFNMYISDSVIAGIGVTLGWGGGVLSVKDCDVQDAAIYLRGDYDGATYGATWDFAGITFYGSAFSQYLVAMDLVGSTLLAIPMPSTIAISRIRRRPQAGGATDTACLTLLQASVRPDAVSVIAPKTVKISDVQVSQRCELNVSWPVQDMDPGDGLTAFELNRLGATRATQAGAPERSTFYVPAATKTVPAATAPVSLKVGECDLVSVQAGNAGESSFEVKDSQLGRLQTPVQRRVEVDGCSLDAAVILSGETNAPIGNTAASGTATLTYTSVLNSRVGNGYDLSASRALQGVRIRSGHNPVLPAGATKATAFTGWQDVSF